VMQRSVGSALLINNNELTEGQIAAKELGIVAYTDRNFMVAFVPVERLSVHLKKSVLVWSSGWNNFTDWF
jgi:hypothetical protein